MKTLNHSYLSRLDHLRFFAAILVIFHHCRGTINYSGSISNFSDFAALWLRWGSTGVTLFLVLSGFLFCVISDAGNKNIKYKDFLKNRILRIAPLATILIFIVICVNRAESSPMDILRLLTLQLNTGHEYTGWGHQFYPTGPIWTIAVEFQFYLIFPFLAVFMKKNGVSTIAGMVLVFILIKLSLVTFHGGGVYYKLYHSIIGRLDQFLIGMVAGYIYLKTKSYNKAIVPIILIAVSLIGLTAFLHFNAKMKVSFMPYSFSVEAFLWSLLILGYLRLNISIPKRLDLSLAYLGGLSFSMYLLHLIVSKFIYMKVLTPPSEKLWYVLNTATVIIPITILLSAITFKFIEKPFLELRVKYTK